jgi:hypothetical protein
MSDPSEDDDPTPQGRLDSTTLHTMGSRSESHPLVASWQLQPNGLSPRHLEIRLDASAYPSGVDGARLDVHWFVTDDYYLHYVETRGDDHYQCRWDRHPKTDASRTHFHPPPNAGPAEESSLDPHHLGVLFTVLEWVSSRVRSLHGCSK